MHKPIYIFIIVLAVLGLGGGTYYAWVTSKKILNPPTNNLLPIPETGVSQNPEPSATVPQQSSGQKLRIVSDQGVAGYWVGGITSSAVLFYVTEEGEVFKTPLTGNSERVTQGIITPVRAVQATKDGRVALIESGHQHAPQFTLFFADTNLLQVLPLSTATSFSPNGKQVAYIDSNGAITVRDLSAKTLTTRKAGVFPHYDATMRWIRTNTLAFLSRPSAHTKGELWEFDLQTKNIKLLDSGLGLINTWSPDGIFQLRFSLDGARGGAMQFLDEKGNARANIASTLPQKCTIDSVRVYCAIARAFSPLLKPLLPDDYLKRATYSHDTFYVLQPSAEHVESLFASSDPLIDAVNLTVAQGHLLFINRYDNKVYSLALN